MLAGAPHRSQAVTAGLLDRMGLVVDACVAPAHGRAEVEAAYLMLERNDPTRRRIIAALKKGCGTHGKPAANQGRPTTAREAGATPAQIAHDLSQYF